MAHREEIGNYNAGFQNNIQQPEHQIQNQPMPSYQPNQPSYVDRTWESEYDKLYKKIGFEVFQKTMQQVIPSMVQQQAKPVKTYEYIDVEDYDSEYDVARRAAKEQFDEGRGVGKFILGFVVVGWAIIRNVI